MTEKRTTKMSRRFLVVGGLIGFAVGVLGSLVAVWLQQELLRNAFTPRLIVSGETLRVLETLRV